MKLKYMFLSLAMMLGSVLHAQNFHLPLKDTLTVEALEAESGMTLDSVRFYANEGSPDAQFYLGYYYTLSTERNAALARKWYSMAAEQGHPEAAFNLGLMYRDGDGVIRDTKKAFAYFHQSAEAGLPLAMFNVALAYNSGIGVEQNKDSAFCWASRGADAGDAQSMYTVALLYYQGLGTKVDKEEATRWAYRSAKAGSADGMALMATLLMEGETVEQNVDKAYEWIVKADSLGSADAGEMKEMIEKYMKLEQPFRKYGLTLKKYMALPDAEFLKVTEQMANDGVAEAQYNLASIYYGGHRGIKKDFKKARYWYREAAKNGFEHAQETLNELGW